MTERHANVSMDVVSHRNEALRLARNGNYAQAKSRLVAATYSHDSQHRVENLLTVMVEGHVELLAGNFDRAKKAYKAALTGLKELDCSPSDEQQAVRDCAWGLLTVAVYVGTPSQIRVAARLVLEGVTYGAMTGVSATGIVTEFDSKRLTMGRALRSTNKFTKVIARNRFTRHFGRDVAASS